MTEVNIMAIVRTIASGAAVVRIDDSCCRGLSAEEAARRWAEVDRVICQINRAHAARGCCQPQADLLREPQTPAD